MIEMKIEWIELNKRKYDTYKHECHLITFETKISIILSINSKDQLLLNGYRYRWNRLTWRCIKDNWKGCSPHNGTTYEMHQSHERQIPDPEEIEKAVYNSTIRKKVEIFTINHDQLYKKQDLNYLLKWLLSFHNIHPYSAESNVFERAIIYQKNLLHLLILWLLIKDGRR